MEENDEDLSPIIDKIMIYRKPIMIVLFIILVMLVVFLGYAYGVASTCDKLGGSFNQQYVSCHLDTPEEEEPCWLGNCINRSLLE